MESRMNKYHEIDINDFQRSKKNAHLYKEVYGNYDDFENLPVPDNTNEIEIDNLKSLVTSRSSLKKEQLKIQEETLEEISDVTKKEKVYDINALLEIAKEENAKIKKEVPVNRNIPNYLANLESDKNTKEIILKYDGDNDEDLPIVKGIKYSTSEINLGDKSINTSTLSLDILSDLKPTGDTIVSEPIKEEVAEKLLENEKEFFDNKVNFSTQDFEDNEEELFYEEKSHTFLKILLIIIGLASLLTAIYFILKEFTNIL